MNIDEIASDIADEEDEEECEDCDEEHSEKAPEKKPGSDTYIDFMSNNMGQDFALRIKGKDMTACERIFNRLYSKIRKNAMPKPVKNDGAYH